MIQSTKKSKGLLKDMSRRGFPAHVEHHKTISDAFTKVLDTYISKQTISEKEDRWEKDLPSNTFDAAKELFHSLSRAPQQVYKKYFEEEEKKQQ